MSDIPYTGYLRRAVAAEAHSRADKRAVRQAVPEKRLCHRPEYRAISDTFVRGAV